MSAWDWSIIGLMAFYSLCMLCATLLYSAEDGPFKAPNGDDGFWP